MVILYPQAYYSKPLHTADTASCGLNVKAIAGPGNPNGCWDWWGFTGKKVFDTKEGSQISTVMAMAADIEAAIKQGQPTQSSDTNSNSNSTSGQQRVRRVPAGAAGRPGSAAAATP